jgi:opacity protein-like surface antigen
MRRLVPATALTTLTALLGAFAALPSQAAETGVYVGGSLGLASANIDDPAADLDFDGDELGWKVLVGVRPIELLAAELSYVDFGEPSAQLGGTRLASDTQALAGFGLVFLPLPLPVDLFAKLGLARVQTDLRSSGGLRLDREDTDFAWGVGAQFGFGSLSIRAEYERFQVEGGDPDLISVGLTYNFL